MSKPILAVTRRLPPAVEARASRDYEARLNAKDTPIPFHPNLWGTHRPTAQTIARAVKDLLRR